LQVIMIHAVYFSVLLILSLPAAADEPAVASVQQVAPGGHGRQRPWLKPGGASLRSSRFGRVQRFAAIA
jgi:hypothetical protein